MNGKALRLKRFFTSPSNRAVIFPLDHGVSCGPIPGLERMEEVIRMGIEGGADAFVLHKGMLRVLESIQGRLPGIFMHLSASTQLGPAFHSKVLVGTIEEAIRRGADGVSVHVNLGDSHEPEMLEQLGRVGSACSEWQIPLLVMIYVRGAHIQQPVPDASIAHAARVAAELGADIIKIPAPKDAGVLSTITSSLPVPIVVAGGSRISESSLFLQQIERYLSAGAKGVATGRNVFQRDCPGGVLRAVSSMVHGNICAKDAWEKFCRTEPSE